MMFASLPGAVVEDGVLLHVGNPLTEQRALEAGSAVAPLGDRRVLGVPGEDRLTWLDSLSSQALARLQPGESSELLILDPQGHVEHAASVVDDGETTWLIADRADAESLLSWLLKMRFRLRVAPAARDDLVVIGGTSAAVAALGADVVWRDPWPGVSVGGWGYADAADHPGRDWAEAIVSADHLEEIVDAASPGAIAGTVAADALRIAAWRPRIADVDERTLPHELDWMRTAVHLDKGCYRGQETVAKVHNLGHPPRRIIALTLDGVVPAPGDEVRAGEVVVGAVTSAAMHHEDGPIALAVVRRNAPVDADLVVDTADGPIAAAQHVIVPPEAGATASVPRIPKLGRRA
ncbi:YgfZ/GcvT domain-containing protein [Microbacterium sp. ASV49]|uniref:Folate-binding protein n=1 Tax=Microbacterium candidum TaxID=3041922 RepID=A0ABT7N2Z1_9MICO|nr:glycine cleavage T C-terminal barrel domain-containing protein [Microbacterium sp. ASV49]MDL9981067.1 folate-binding protein [Microbacterium sp. ASV49]